MSQLEDRIGRVVAEKFSASFMSDTKWHKLIDQLTDAFDELHVRYKLIYDDDISSAAISAPDQKPFLKEPILYREIEWLEFPAEYVDYVSKDNHKAGKASYHLDQ